MLTAVPTDSRPTRVRYGVLLFLCLLSFILYMDRICMNQAAPRIQEDLEIAPVWMGVVHFAFLLAYGIFEVPTGHWGDRYGSRGVLTRIVLWWSLFTALTGSATGLVLLLVMRFLFGAGEAGALPNSARVVARWFPPGGRGPAQGVVTTSMLLGGVLAPPVAQALMNQVGWRWTFAVFGSIGIAWAVSFWWWFRDDPAMHSRVNQAEYALIVHNRDSGGLEKPRHPLPWRSVLRKANLWLLGGVISCSAFVSYLYYTWYSSYLQQGRGLSLDLSSWLTSAVLAGGALGCVAGGYLNDWLVRRTGRKRVVRCALGSGGLALAALALLASVRCESPWSAALWTSLAFFVAMVQVTTWWAVVTEISGKHLGALFGLMNSMGVPGASVSVLFLGWLVGWLEQQGRDGRDRWDPAFYVYAAVLVVGAVGWMFIDATKSLVDEKA